MTTSIMSRNRTMFLSITNYLFVIVGAFNVARDMLTKDYDADLDHHMYFGQRLLAGELIWTREIYDKFPLIQYLFGFPAYFNSPRSWVLLSAFMLATSAILLYISTPKLLNIKILPESDALKTELPLLSASFYFFLATATPPSLVHINSFTTSCLVIAVCLLVNSNRHDDETNRFHIVTMLIGSMMFSAVAISIRPFLALPIMQIVFWTHALDAMYIGNRTERNFIIWKTTREINSIIRIMNNTIKWTIGTGILLLIMNFVPYILTDNIEDMINGIYHNSQKLNPQSPSNIIAEQWKTVTSINNIYYIIMAVSTVIFMVLYCMVDYSRSRSASVLETRDFNIMISRKTIYDLLLGVALPITSLEIIILARHWWDHYWQMFVLFGTIHFMISSRIILLVTEKYSNRSSKISILNIICGILIGFIFGFNANQEVIHPQSRKLQEIREFLDDRRVNSLETDFLDIGDMYSHWQLAEPRYGFPHAQNIQHIVLGWYSSINRIDHLAFPYTRDELCSQVKDRGPNVVFMTFSYMFSCLLSKESGYELVRNTEKLIIFVRFHPDKLTKYIDVISN